MRFSLALALTLALARPGAGAAQDVAALPGSEATTRRVMACSRAGCLQEGSVVRVTATAPLLDRHRSLVTGLTRDTLFLAAGRGSAPTAVPLARLTRLEIGGGRPGHAEPMVAGAVLGVLGGAVAGGLIGYYGSGGGSGREMSGLGAIVGIPVGALVGGLVGAAIGSSFGERESWRRVRLPLNLS